MLPAPTMRVNSGGGVSTTNQLSSRFSWCHPYCLTKRKSNSGVIYAILRNVELAPAAFDVRGTPRLSNSAAAFCPPTRAVLIVSVFIVGSVRTVAKPNVACRACTPYTHHSSFPTFEPLRFVLPLLFNPSIHGSAATIFFFVHENGTI